MGHHLRMVSVSGLFLLGLAPMAHAAPISASALVDDTGTTGIETFSIANQSKAGGSFDRVTIDLGTVGTPGQAFNLARGPFKVRDSSTGLGAADVSAAFSGALDATAHPGLDELLTLDFSNGKFTPGSSLIFDVGTDQLNPAGPSQTAASLAGAKVTVSSGSDLASGLLTPSGRSLAQINSALGSPNGDSLGGSNPPGIIESSGNVPEPASLFVWSTLGLLGWRARRPKKSDE